MNTEQYPSLKKFLHSKGLTQKEIDTLQITDAKVDLNNTYGNFIQLVSSLSTNHLSDCLRLSQADRDEFEIYGYENGVEFIEGFFIFEKKCSLNVTINGESLLNILFNYMC